MEQWTALGAIATTVGVGVAIVGGLFGWLSRQFAKITDHLTEQDGDIRELKADMRWVKDELKNKQDKPGGGS
ncbi:hypothetical protein SPF06_01115 [Sinomonas sp. JGH33]|uniref:Uncharacterized protein n=1 Tax=Sinomonas terricola TaxID=3110330 RepID=A0ABU5T1E2_9MICC|nr:hypothetical protein [Sinomonas sp. JGH33]MEA5453311.1 hypothetical protein [Sinomonas sp. JGH33]